MVALRQKVMCDLWDHVACFLCWLGKRSRRGAPPQWAGAPASHAALPRCRGTSPDPPESPEESHPQIQTLLWTQGSVQSHFRGAYPQCFPFPLAIEQIHTMWSYGNHKLIIWPRWPRVSGDTGSAWHSTRFSTDAFYLQLLSAVMLPHSRKMCVL